MVQGINPTDILREEKEAVTLQIAGNYIPWFVKKYTIFLPVMSIYRSRSRDGKLNFPGLAYRLHREPIYSEFVSMAKVKLLSYRKSLLEHALFRDVLKRNNLSGGKTGIVIGSRIMNVLKNGF
jgi:hypothetical protein